MHHSAGRRRRQRADSATDQCDALHSNPVSRVSRLSRWLAPAVVCALGTLSTTQAAITNRVDGVTYCWDADGSVYSSDLSDSTPVVEGEAKDCALTMTLVLDQSKYHVNEAFKATWTATIRQDENGQLVSNKFGVSELHTAIERITLKQVEIVYSRIESCAASASNCDPVTGHTEIAQNVLNQPVNFTDSAASFVTERLSFTTAGDVRIIAHLILPGADPESKRYDFAIYRTVAISERPSLTSTTTSPSESQRQEAASVAESQGLSTEVICLLFVGGMVVVVLAGLGFTMLRKEKEELPSSVRKGLDNRSRHDATSTDVDDEFAMLSNDERLMQSQRVPDRPANTFLSASAPIEPSMMEESRAKAKGKLAVYETRGHHPGIDVAAELARDDHIVDTTTPASMRHDGMYMEMKPAISVPKQSKLPPPSKIYFNDIHEDEIIDNGGRIKGASRSGMTMSKAVGSFVDARSPRGDTGIRSVADRLRNLPVDLDDEKPVGAWRPTSTMTFDDLRGSTDLGPALTLEDLLESQKFRKKSKELEV